MHRQQTALVLLFLNIYLTAVRRLIQFLQAGSLCTFRTASQDKSSHANVLQTLHNELKSEKKCNLGKHQCMPQSRQRMEQFRRGLHAEWMLILAFKVIVHCFFHFLPTVQYRVGSDSSFSTLNENYLLFLSSKAIFFSAKIIIERSFVFAFSSYLFFCQLVLAL